MEVLSGFSKVGFVENYGLNQNDPNSNSLLGDLNKAAQNPIVYQAIV